MNTHETACRSRLNVQTLLALLIGISAGISVFATEEVFAHGDGGISRFALGLDTGTNSVASNGHATAVSKSGAGASLGMQFTYTHSSHWTLGVQFKTSSWADSLHSDRTSEPWLYANSAMGLIGYGSERWLLWSGAGLASVKGRELASVPEDATQSEYDYYYLAGKAHVYEIGGLVTLLRGEHWGLDLTGRFEMIVMPQFPAGGARDTAGMARMTAGLQLSKTILHGKNGDRLLNYFLLPAEVYMREPGGALIVTAFGNGFVFCGNIIDGALGNITEIIL